MAEEFAAIWESASVLRFRGRCSADQAVKAEQALARAESSIEVDFSELNWMTSAGIGVLLAAQQRLQAQGDSLKIVNVSPVIREMFEIAGFDQVFEMESEVVAGPADERPSRERTGADLVTASLEGDRSAFPEIVDRYQIQVFNAAYRITGSRADAEDVAQVSFLRVYERLDRFDPKYRLFSWIYKICVNESLNLVAKRRSSGEVDRQLVDVSADPEREARGREIGREIRRALVELKPAHRVVVVLRHFRGLAYDEMSAVLEIPVKTVKSRLFEARRDLRRALAARKLR